MQTKLKPIEDITPFTMLDYKGHPSAIVWFSGCNMRCGYCYNPEIVYSKGKITLKEALQFLQSRKDLLRGVVLSGGEPTLYNRIIYFAKELKQMGYRVKLDTNGTKPEVLKRMLEAKVVDFVSLDYKAPKEKFTDITKMSIKGFEEVAKSLTYLRDGKIDHEIRTTIHPELLEEQDICTIIQTLKQNSVKKRLYLQNFMESKNLANIQRPAKAYDMTQLVQSANENGIELHFRNF